MPPNIISLDEAAKLSDEAEFWAVRGKAVQAYANVEQSLCKLFTAFAGTTEEIGAIIFFKIVNSAARNAILEKLFKIRFADKYNVFRNSLIEQLRPLDIERNEIVHWNAINHVSHDGARTTVDVCLRPPAQTKFHLDGPEKDTASLLRFIEKCDFFSRLLNIFHWLIVVNHQSFSDDDKVKWQQVFSGPLVYPPPHDHPLLSQPPIPNA